MRNHIMTAVFIFAICFCTGCSTYTPKPIPYLALRKPIGFIGNINHKPVEKNFGRGGFYLCTYNFRPTADMDFYIKQACEEAGSNILRGADIRLEIPTKIDLIGTVLLAPIVFFPTFGYNTATDTVSATGK
ncbi:Uncharacterized protein dnl_41490 [Desulfonema limicola]|uniref:Uncharacterized protein n=1 Tax=Desulfonema limicola TaxID=45656 RepID=A0A975BA22_9BACT|nr:hypothetical protein [Desulfonema limicola]QTA81799.1 Uncharacterized protein dnl_41490 [Desulfonema limicola]